MICEKYNQLTPFEQIIFHAKLWHAVINDEKYFAIAEDVVQLAVAKGMFDKIEIMPERQKENTDLFENIVLGKPIKSL